MREQISRSKEHIFADILEQQFLHHLVNVRVLGDWMFTGKLQELRSKHEISLFDVTVTSCGGQTICTFDVSQVNIQLKDIISVGKPAL